MIIVWNLVNVKTTSSCAIRPRAVSVGMDTQVYIKYIREIKSLYVKNIMVYVKGFLCFNKFP